MAVSLHCPHCHQLTALSMARAAWSHGYDSGTTSAQWTNSNGYRWWIGVCNGCGKPCLVLEEGQIVYPSASPTPTDPHIPKELAADLDEAKMCASHECFRACAAMARRCIQQACIVKGATAADLVGQIKELTHSGVITKDIEEWATVVRWVGNDAAHPGKLPVTKEDAEDVLKLAEQFLHVIFVTPAIAKARRAARGK